MGMPVTPPVNNHIHNPPLNIVGFGPQGPQGNQPGVVLLDFTNVPVLGASQLNNQVAAQVDEIAVAQIHPNND